jgi:segregation and condensation protein B
MDDDKEALCFATDCMANDCKMRHIDDGAFADISLPVEFDSSLPLGGKPARTFAVAVVDDESAADARDASPGCSTPRVDGNGALARQVIEALLFSSDAPLSAARLADLVEGCTPAAARAHVEALNEKYERAGLAFRIETIARGYQMMTLPDFRGWIEKLNQHRQDTRLSAAALETLAIIAYKQPIIRAEVEAIRGVACAEVISRLREMGLVRVLGRAEIVGRPLLYGTTKKFLEVFGLADLDDLPPIEALQLKSASKPVEQVEPVKLPAIPEPPIEKIAVGSS